MHALARRLPALRWPLPALATWLGCWLLFHTLRQLSAPLPLALLAAMLLGLLLAWTQVERWRRLIMAAGFPLSMLLSLPAGQGPAWLWLLPALGLLLLYPQRSWRDAPLFPTPSGGLEPLAQRLSLPTGARVLDAGCGLGHGLRELHRAFPAARIEGVEWSAPLAWLARWRCPWAQVRRGDMWAIDWRPYQLVYVFQRPESMAQVWRQSREQMHTEAYLVSLDFDIPEAVAEASYQVGARHRLWVYRVGELQRAAMAHRPVLD